MTFNKGPGNRPFFIAQVGEVRGASFGNKDRFSGYAQAQSGPPFFALVESIRAR